MHFHKVFLICNFFPSLRTGVGLSSPFSHQKRGRLTACTSSYYEASSTILRIVAVASWTLPRPKKCPPDTFYPSLRTGVGLSSPFPHQKRGRLTASSFLVREMGLEPTRRNHTHLKRACLPFQHSRKTIVLYAFPGVLSTLIFTFLTAFHKNVNGPLLTNFY